MYHLCGFDIIPRNAIVYDMHFETAILCVDIVTLRACIRGKAIGFVCCRLLLSVVCRRHKNCQISSSTYLCVM